MSTVDRANFEKFKTNLQNATDPDVAAANFNQLIKLLDRCGIKLDNVTNDLLELEVEMRNSQPEVDKTAGAFQRLMTALKDQSFAKGFTEAFQGVTQLLFALQGVKGIVNTLKDDNIELSDKILSISTSLAMTIPMFVNGGKSLFEGIKLVSNGLSSASGPLISFANTLPWVAKGAGAAGGSITTLGGAIGALVAPVAIAAAAIIGLSVAIKLLYDKYTEDARALEEAKKEQKQQTKAVQEAQQAYDELKSSLENYQKAADAIDDLTIGTQEWRDAIKQCNE